MLFIKILLAEGSTLAKVLGPFLPQAVSVFSFAKMVALASYGGGQCRSPPHRWLANSLVLPCHPWTTHGAASTTSEPKASDFGCRVMRTSAKMVDAQPSGVSCLYQDGDGRFPARAYPILCKCQGRAAAASLGAAGGKSSCGEHPGRARWSCRSLRPRQQQARDVTCRGAKVTSPNPKATQTQPFPESHKW